MRYASKGFALPTIVVASVILFMVLVAAVSTVTSVGVALDTQYYQQLAKDAAESGVIHASDCLNANGFVAGWSAGSQLRPNTACTGGAACTNVDKCFVLKDVDTKFYSQYAVGAVVENGDGTQTLTSVGTVSLLRKSSGLPWKTYTYTGKAIVGGQIKAQSTAFGYVLNPGGAFYATLGGDGKLRVGGLNNWGQLGNGNTTNQTQAIPYTIGSASPITGAYANYLATSASLFVTTANGEVWGSGLNDVGQLGNGTVSSAQTTPMKFNLPAGKIASYVAPGMYVNYVVTTDGNIYAAGKCDQGILGSSYTIPGCTNRANYVRVNLPTPNVSDPNTLPSTNFVFDRANAYVRMQGGRVYGWGANEYGQLANSTHIDSSTPVQLGTYGNSGQPKATQVAFDGDTVYILDDIGKVYSAGLNAFGESGTDAMQLFLLYKDRCLGNNNGDGVTVTFGTCNGSNRQRWMHNGSNSLLYNTSSGKCLDNTGGDGYNLGLWDCVVDPTQQFSYVFPFSYQIGSVNKMIDNEGGNNVTVKLYAPFFSANQAIAGSNFSLVPWTGWNGSFTKKIVKIATDQWSLSVLTDTGEVYSAGINTSGMFGDGTQLQYNPYPRKFALPAGVSAVDLYNTNSSSPENYQYQNLYVVGDNGKVYGAGSNTFGQLGNGTTAAAQTTPVAMNVVGTVNGRAVSVQAGYGSAVILTSSGVTYTVGNNNTGQLGDGTTTNSSTPILGKFLNDSRATSY
ncbi:MAG: ricin-type beta-trefoil lectin domain protein [Candidatus Saccharimonas sp.]